MRMTMTMLAVIVALAGCNTVEGLGRDIERGGEAIEDAAEDAAS